MNHTLLRALPLVLPALLVGCAEARPGECASTFDCGTDAVCGAEGVCVGRSAPIAVGPGAAGNGGFEQNFDNPFTPIEGLDDGHVAGDIGIVRGVDAPGLVSGNFGGGYTSLTVAFSDDVGTGLVILTLTSSLLELPVGESRVTGGDADGTEWVQLCSDDPDGNHFDGMAEDATVVVTEDDTGRDIAIDAVITNGFDGYGYDGAEPTTVHTTFHVVR